MKTKGSMQWQSELSKKLRKGQALVKVFPTTSNQKPAWAGVVWQRQRSGREIAVETCAKHLDDLPLHTGRVIVEYPSSAVAFFWMDIQEDVFGLETRLIPKADVPPPSVPKVNPFATLKVSATPSPKKAVEVKPEPKRKVRRLPAGLLQHSPTILADGYIGVALFAKGNPEPFYTLGVEADDSDKMVWTANEVYRHACRQDELEPEEVFTARIEYPSRYEYKQFHSQPKGA